MSVNEKDYKSEAEALLTQPEGSLPPSQIFERLHRWGVWRRGNIHPRGSLTAPAESLLDANSMKRILFYVGHEIEPETCRKALLALGQWGGKECLDVAIGMLQSEKTDPETRLYCLSAIRTIGGPRAVAAIAQVLKSGERDMHAAALNAILDLATGGSKSDIDLATDASPVVAANALRPEVAAELSAALSEVSERKSVAFNVRYRAVDTLEYLRESGMLVTLADTKGVIPPGSRFNTPQPGLYVFPDAIFHAAAFAGASKGAPAVEPLKPKTWDLPEHNLHVEGTPQPGGEYRFEAHTPAPELANKIIRFALIGVKTGEPTAQFAIKLDYYSSERARWEGSDQISVADLPEESNLVLQRLEA